MSNFKISSVPASTCVRSFVTDPDPCAGEPRRVAKYGRAWKATPNVIQGYPPQAMTETRPPNPDITQTVNVGPVDSVRCGRLRPPHGDPAVEAKECPIYRGEMDWCQPVLDCGGPDPPMQAPPPRCFTDEELEGTGWGYCPPCGDYRKLIRPLPPGTPSGQRPTGQPYFTHGYAITKETEIPRCCKKNKFTFCDWKDSVEAREAPYHLQGNCIPSLGNICQPYYMDCCPNPQDPSNFTLTKADDICTWKSRGYERF